MRNNSNYHRSFIMMKEEDKGFGKSGKPTGYLKLEVTNSTGKALVHIQNIGALEDKNVLKAYLLSSTEKNGEPLCLGTIELKGDHGDVTCVFTREMVKKAKTGIGRLDTIVIVSKNIEADDSPQTFPLVGFKKNAWDWKAAFEEKGRTIDRVSAEEAGKSIKIDVKTDEIDEIIEEDLRQADEQSLTDNQEVGAYEEEKDTDIAPQRLTEESSMDGDESETVEIKDISADQEENKENQLRVTVKPVWHSDLKTETAQEAEENRDTYSEGEDYAEEPRKKDIRAQLSRYMKANGPFTDGDIGYQWWAVNDCRFMLHNRYANYRTIPVLYNLHTINIVHRYGHYLFGIKEDEQQHVKYIAYAIPARYGLDPHPMLQAQGYTYWLPRKGEKAAIGEAGYWIIKINASNGEFIFSGEDG
ncbi:MAG: hypothetical protein MJB12_08960 [Firmicutes bacterium]|nr:hypothetical protein [Bacillota bacterium]